MAKGENIHQIIARQRGTVDSERANVQRLLSQPTADMGIDRLPVGKANDAIADGISIVSRADLGCGA